MIDVILPVLNEERALGPLLESFPSGYRPIVVDNASTDDSVAIANAHGAMVVSEPQRGFGAACWTGLNAATADVVCFMDADGSLDPAELPLVALPVEGGAADLMLGRRVLEPGSMPPHARLANKYLAHRVRRLTGVSLSDMGPMRAAPRQKLLELGMTDRRFGWPLEMVMRAASEGWRIHETGVTYRRRKGRSKVTGTVKGTIRAISDMSKFLE